MTVIPLTDCILGRATPAQATLPGRFVLRHGIILDAAVGGENGNVFQLEARTAK